MPTLFGLFSRKQDHSNSPPQDSAHVHSRTPSPPMHVAGPSSPFPLMPAHPVSPLRHSLSQLAVHSDTDSPDKPAHVQTLHRLFSSVPAKTLHSYTLAHLRNASPSTLAAFTSFYSNLQPPPQLHCVRCHKEYVEIENDDRSCLVPHDDDSALVERVGRMSKRKDAPLYETLWQCCGKTIEGDGDQGPPDGWCYEGKHTTDIKRARFRADSTPQDDKLKSCIRQNCKGVQTQLQGVRTTRHKRTRSLKDTTDDGSSDHESYMDAVSGTGSVRGRTTRKVVSAATETRAKSTDGRSVAKQKSSRRAASVSAKPRGRARKSASKKVDHGEEADREEDNPKKKRKVA